MRHTFIFLGILLLLSLSLVTFLAFYTAYSSPTKSVRILINNYGEADIELILMTIILPLTVITALFMLKEVDNRIMEDRIAKSIEKRRMRY